MLSGKAVGSVAAVLLVVGLLQVVPSYSQVSGGEPAGADPAAANCPDHEDPEDYIWDSADVVEVLLNETTITASGVGATIDGTIVTITRSGTYDVSGILADGQIVVNSTDKGTVRLILDGVDIHCSSSAPVLVEKAKKTVIVLAEDTENYLSDGRSGMVEGLQTEEPNAVIFSKDDLTICGTGWLSVCGDVNDGISSKDGLIIAGGTIDIDAVDDGIRGKDYLVVRGGEILVNAGGDGLKSDNEQDQTKGYVSIEAGVLNIVSGANAIQAETDVLIADGEITLRSGGGTNRRAGAGTVGKGISAGVSVVVDGGDLDINSGDDALHSNDRLAINGGTFVLSSTDDAIHADSGVEIHGGDIQVTWCYEGIDSNAITVTGGTIQIVSGDDGIIAAEHVSIVDGVVDITAAGDAIAALTDVTIAGGQLILSSGGGSNTRATTTTSAKGIKGISGVVIDGGILTVDSADDAVHSDANVTINGGVFAISTGDDGIHANADLVINGGDIRITKSYEGLESTDANITINGGQIHIVSNDDGINVSAGGDQFAMGGPGAWPGGGGVTPVVSGDHYLYVNGGYLVIDAAGDGIDSNGSVVMTDGVIIVHGPTTSMNAALDHLSFQMTGGFLLAAGNSGMAQAPSTSSTQYSILLTFNTMLPAQTLVHIQGSGGEDILSFVPSKQYNSVAFSSQDLVKGSTYDVYYGGSSTGTVSDGLYQDGVYTPGTKYASFTISSMVTNVGANTGGGNVPGGGGNVPGGGGGVVRR
ncbi:MAG TPA: carbohydrate-binding domain-containing protein [Sedimentisphaerales bacterium]|nr:carbohydrate-binding domain-containing protein [Sedimentisphaerales bacterium]HRS11164.1 carbohydrate-binding domain-containing protein [Sedimentisphaerales bacterium]HRV47742.1 carbohydrate-binding domain-containing protein [Sedimentisphaerales bacterium]